jgi:deoxyribodipyrimidine photolyase-related protein
MRNLILVLGDQLDEHSAAFDDFDPVRDRVWMAEVAAESTHVWSHPARIVMFLAAMRHFRDRLRVRGWPIDYQTLEGESQAGASLDDSAPPSTFAAALEATLRRRQPARLIVVEPGEWRVERELVETARRHGVKLEIRPDRHFYCSREEFAAHARGRKQLRLEYFYRELRRRTGVLMNGDQPAGGDWNYDAENRGAFGKQGPGPIPPPRRFPPDATTQEVIDLVRRKFAGHPGRLDAFDYPVTAAAARQALDDFIEHRLPRFGQYQDAMWTDEPLLYHSRLSAALNLKLLDPRQVIAAAVAAYEEGRAPLPAVEGFVRQILGWREYVRGIYGLTMPDYLERNALGAHAPLPDFYWTGDTDLRCLRETIGQTLASGYAHHIQRLMVTGLFALLLGVEPKQVHAWYLAMYVDAVEWVELPNTLGMSQFADGGLMASKPYVATGNYIHRMSNYCQGCRYHPAAATGADACPFTTLYWDFLARHRPLLVRNQRMSLQIKNLDRKPAEELAAIRAQAATLRQRWCRG